MDPLDNPDSPFGPVYHNSPTTTNDVQNFYKAQCDAMAMPPPPPPPGAAPTYPTTSTLPPQVGLGTRILSTTGNYNHTIEMPTPRSTGSPSDGSETSLHDRTSIHGSTSPTPRESHVDRLRHSRPQYSHLSPPPPTLGTQNNLFRSHRRAFAHFQSSFQQGLMHLMSSPSAVHGGEGGPVGAGPSTGPRRSTPVVSGLSLAQLAQLTGSSDTAYLALSASRYRVLGLAPSGAKRRFEEVDTLDTQYGPVDILNQDASENQPTLDTYTSYSRSSSPPTTSTAQYPPAVSADPVQVPSSLSNYESVLPPHSGESSQLASSSGLQDDVDNDATLSPRHASSGTPSHFTDYTLPHQGTPLEAPEAPRKKRRTGQRKRVAKPKDPRAAERLQNQRESDESNLEELYRLFVPESVGAVPKKDRSAIILHYGRKFKEARSNSRQESTTLYQDGKNWPASSSQQDGRTD